MRKILSILLAFALVCFTLTAEEKTLLDPASTASISDNISYVENFTADSSSGWFNSDNLKVLVPAQVGDDTFFRVMAIDVPRYDVSYYDLLPAYPSFLNEGQEGGGAITNAAAIKKVSVKVMFNRPYDEILLLYSTSPTGPVKTIKLQSENDIAIGTMVPVTMVSGDLGYNDDVKTREIKADPVLGGDSTGVYFRGFRIRVNPAYGINSYSPWSIVYLSKVEVIYDKRFTDEQWEMREKLKEEWNIDDGSATAKLKATNEITYRKQLEAVEAEKMHKDSQ